MKSVIITGADGFVGSYTVQCFLEHGIEVLALDIMEEPRRLKVSGGLTYKCIDISDTNNLLHAVEAG